jgi:hypothetical protein
MKKLEDKILWLALIAFVIWCFYVFYRMGVI